MISMFKKNQFSNKCSLCEH